MSVGMEQILSGAVTLRIGGAGGLSLGHRALPPGSALLGWWTSLVDYLSRVQEASRDPLLGRRLAPMVKVPGSQVPE